ncbi:MAG: hypothetical protein PHH16_02945 [Candidatus Gracilibacteria bacterium]|nr:hypothetical protein [Candidatus Gracilibacteria bacterium]
MKNKTSPTISVCQEFGDSGVLASICKKKEEDSEKILGAQQDIIHNEVLLLRYKIDEAFRQIQIDQGRNFLDPSQKKGHYMSMDHYPLGFCREIAVVTKDILAYSSSPCIRIPVKTDSSKDPISRAIIQNLVAKEGKRVGEKLGNILKPARYNQLPIKKTFGTIRDDYFHNVIQIGGYILDVGLDTIEGVDNKVLFTKISESPFKEIASYEQYAYVAEKYWGVRIIPNTVFPSISPMYPLLMVDHDGKIKIGDPNLRFLDIINGCRLSEKYLKEHIQELSNIPEEWMHVLFSAISTNETLDIQIPTIPSQWDSLEKQLKIWRRAHKKALQGDDTDFHKIITEAMQMVSKINTLDIKVSIPINTV